MLKVTTHFIRTSHVRFCSAFKRTSIKLALSDKTLIGRDIEVQGWIKSARVQKCRIFLDLDDGIYPGQRLQVLLDKEKIQVQNEDLLKYHSSVKIQGTLQESDHPAQEVELIAKEPAEILNPVKNPDYPFAPRKTFNPEFVRQYPMFNAKLNEVSSLLRIRNNLSQSVHSFFQDLDFVQIQTPILTSNDCEGAGEVFSVKPFKEVQVNDPLTFLEDSYFNAEKVFLTVSGQLHLEAICNGIGRVYNFSPVFRAERGRSRRHLTEFSMIESEVAFVDSVSDITSLAEDLLKSALQTFLDKSQMDIGIYSKIRKENNMKNVEKALQNDFKIMTHKEAHEILSGKKFQSSPKFGKPLGKEHELYLVEKHCNNVPVFIVEWPCETKPFYARRNKSDSEKVDAFDLLLPGIGELVGGSLREYNFEMLEKSIEKLKLDRDSTQWYLNMRASGSAPTGGFGLGFERLVQFCLGVNNIKDTMPFPRSPHFILL